MVHQPDPNYSEEYLDYKEVLRTEIPKIQDGIALYKEKDLFTSHKRELNWGRSAVNYYRIGINMHIDRYRRKMFQHVAPTMQDLDEIGLFEHFHENVIPLIDLGAVPLEKVRDGSLRLETLTQLGIKEIALMEDRDPMFFLNFTEFRSEEVVPLNRHGVGRQEKVTWTMDDMKSFIDMCHAEGIKVFQGFWGNMGNMQNNPFLRENKELSTPVILGSDDINPLSEVISPSGKRQLFVEYIIEQYEKLHEAFEIDGLFLGDGFMGYRSFFRSNFVGDFSFAHTGWNAFYKVLSDAVHAKGGALMAYDVMGRNYHDAYHSGVDYKKVLPHVDKLFVQTYGQSAWNRYMKQHKYTLDRDVQVLENLNLHLSSEDRSKLFYTAELGDNVEGWLGSKDIVRRQFEAQRELVRGVLKVWGNEVIYNVLKSS